MWDICQKVIFQKVLILQGVGSETRDFIHALDIAKALEIVCNRAPMQGEAYNLGSGREVAIFELANMILGFLDKNIDIRFDGNQFAGNPLNWQSDISRIESLGFSPTVQFEQGIKVFANWCLAELVGV